MATIRQVTERVNSLNLKETAIQTVHEHEPEFEELNRRQMLAGKNKDGQKLPRYVDDPYFKSRESALRYQAWKDKISPDRSKDSGVMDFYINGKFHNSIEVHAKGSAIDYISNSPIASSISGKTGGKHLGLSKEYYAKACDEFFRKALMDKVHFITKL